MNRSSTATPKVLAQVAGSYRERVPATALQPYFARIWLNRFPPGRPRRLAVAPDGCIDLQWIDGVLRIAGPDRQAHIEELPGGATVIGMRFQPGVAASWLRIPACEIVDQRLPLEAFWGSEAKQVAEWVGEARSARLIAGRLEAAMARKAAALAVPADAASRHIFRLVSAAWQPGIGVVELLSRRVGLSERTLRRRCHAAFGYGPKTLHRILRFQRFLRMARAADPAALADMAAACGYADQAHLSREARCMAGLTAGEIVAQLGG